jgi:hypothetical protein
MRTPCLLLILLFIFTGCSNKADAEIAQFKEHETRCNRYIEEYPHLADLLSEKLKITKKHFQKAQSDNNPAESLERVNRNFGGDAYFCLMYLESLQDEIRQLRKQLTSAHDSGVGRQTQESADDIQRKFKNPPYPLDGEAQTVLFLQNHIRVLQAKVDTLESYAKQDQK